MRFYIPLVEELLIKAGTKIKHFKVNLGTWKGLTILCLGPKGGKIVGYDSSGKAIYAGSTKAMKLAAVHALKDKKPAAEQPDLATKWLEALDIPHQVVGNEVFVQPAVATVLQEHFHVTPLTTGKFWRFSLGELQAHMGQPLKPKEEELLTWAATHAAGDHDTTVFPDLSKLKQIDAGKYAGSHGNLVFQDPSGRKWIFKNNNPTIARAEEAACRIARLVLGEGKVPPAKYVQINGTDGVLVGELPGETIQEGHHGTVDSWVKQHFEELVQHQVLDWLVSNHDSHSGNFLTDEKGHIAAIDKGQAWRFFGKDELAPEFKPNNSPPVYNRMWELFQNGKLQGDPIAAAAKAINAAEKIDSQQFVQIIAPYVATAAGYAGFNPEQRANQMAKRLGQLRQDWEAFLSKMTGQKVHIPYDGKDNFETMPEVEAKPKKGVKKPKKEKLVITEPDKPAVLENPPQESVPEAAPPAGWPITKGSVTVHHPGTPPESHLTWPKGYPGPGFQADVTYKFQKYTVKFTTEGAAMSVQMTYPDGSTMSWPSPNAAADSMVLWVKKLDMTMNATQKKKAGISYPATKAFGIGTFAEEFKQALTGEKSIPAMTPAELVKQKVVAPETKTLTVSDMLAKLPDGLVTDMASLPVEVQDAAKAHKKAAAGSDYGDCLPPGTVAKLGTGVDKYGEPDPIWVYVSKVGPQGQGVYDIFSLGSDGNIIETWHNQDPKEHLLHEIPEIAEAITAAKPVQTAKPAPAIGEPPAVELPKTATVPPGAPKTYATVAPPGTVIKVQKKGLGDVSLTVHQDGTFTASFGDKSQTFKSLSSACDWVWVNQQGFASAADFKAAKGVSKIPSGGGWKFWGLKAAPPVTDTPPVNAPVAAPANVVPSWKQLKDAPLNTVYAVVKPGKSVVTYTHVAPGKWIGKHKKIQKEMLPSEVEQALKEYHALGAAIDSAAPVEAPNNFETMPESSPEQTIASVAKKTADTGAPLGKVPTVKEILALPDDATVTIHGKKETVKFFKKQGDWYASWPDIDNKAVASHSKEVQQAIAEAFKNNEKVTSPNNFETMPEAAPAYTKEALNADPAGTKITVTHSDAKGVYTYVKKVDGSWSVNTPVNKDGTILPPTLADALGLWQSTAQIDKVLPGQEAPDNFETMPVVEGEPYTNTAAPHEKLLGALKEGASYTIVYGDETLRFTKTDTGWVIQGGNKEGVYNEASPTTPVSISQVLNSAIEQGRKIFYKKAPAKPTPQYMGPIVIKPPTIGGDDKKPAAIPANPGHLLIFQPTVEDLNDYQPGLYFEWHDGSQIQLAKLPSGKWQYTDGDNLIGVLDAVSATQVLDSAREDFSVTIHEPSSPSTAVIAAGKGAVLTDLSSFPEATHQHVQSVLESAKKSPWTDITETGASIGTKPSHWPDWAPPPGAWVQGELNGKKYWFCTTVSGVHYKTGEPLENYNVAVVSEDGKLHHGSDVSASGAIKSLRYAVEQAIGGDITVAQLKDMFGLKTLTFPAGSTIASLKNSPAPVQAPTSAAKKVKLPIHSAIKLIAKKSLGVDPSKVVVKPAKKAGHTNICINNSHLAAEQLQKLANELGLEKDLANKGGVPQSAFKGAYMTVPTVLLGQDVELTATPEDLAGLDIPEEASPDNFETMPESKPVPAPKPKTLSADAKMAQAVAAWAKDHPPVSAKDHLLILSHLQAKYPKAAIWARMEGDALVIGSDSKQLKAFLDKSPHALIKTPMGGFYKITPEALNWHMDGVATMVKGPDGVMYPPGTTFTEEKVSHKVQDLLPNEPGFHKFTPHNNKPGVLIAKIKGNGPEQVAQAKAMIAKFDLKAGEPFPGGSNTLFELPATELEKVGQVETKTTPKVPPQPPGFVPAPLPGAASAITVGQPAPNNRTDLAFMESITPPKFGHAVRFGKAGFLRNHQVHVRKVKDHTGKVFYEVSGDLAGKFYAAKSQLKSGSVPLYTSMTKEGPGGAMLHNYDPATGIHDEGAYPEKIRTYEGYQGTSESGTYVRLFSGPKTFKNTFIVRIPADKDIETELAVGFGMMGVNVDKAMAAPGLADERIFKKSQIVRSMVGVKGFNEITGAQYANENFLDEKLLELGVSKSLVDTAEVKTVFGTAQGVVVDDADRIKKLGIAFVYQGQSGWESVMHQILEGAGWSSRKTRYLNGVQTSGASASSDEASGGASGAFCRIGRITHDYSWGMKCEDVKVIFHPRVLQRTDWWCYDGDYYGETYASGHGGYSSAKGRYESLDVHSSNNEVLFEHGVPLQDVAGIAVNHESTKKALVSALKKKGVTEVNGIPLEQFVVVHSNHNRTELAKKLVGLKPGALP